ncbi:hypothetical protein H312_01813 [Anncaliia algerae PRA339]|uniref:Uncharacterized protein n=1 Tax=Anncaliia algerae PRA339 TaxID=1288291 RepID=A0A059F0Q2_9MICR|nr:hypothetical protein H312_01813 [Anncaliia algerae PRA339]
MIQYLILLVLMLVVFIMFLIKQSRSNRADYEDNPQIIEQKSVEKLIIDIIELLITLTDISFYSNKKIGKLMREYFKNRNKEIVKYLYENVNLQFLHTHKSCEIFKYIIYECVKENGFTIDFYSNPQCKVQGDGDINLLLRFLAYSAPKKNFRGITQLTISPFIEIEYSLSISDSLNKYAMSKNLGSSVDGPLFLTIFFKNLVAPKKIQKNNLKYLFFLNYRFYLMVVYKNNEVVVLKNEDLSNYNSFYVSMVIYKIEKEHNHNFFN